MDRTKRGLNWGCGSVVADDWINVDPDPLLAPVVDARDTSDFADGCFDGIVANHSLQCLTYDELDAAVAELARVLRPGGRLRVLVPDVVAAFDAYRTGEVMWAGFAAISEPWPLYRKFAHYLTWGGSNRSTFTVESLEDLLYDGGFRGTVHPGDPWPWLTTLDTRRDESISLEVATTP